MCAGAAGWDYDVQAQSIQARLLDLNSIMPGALRRLDMSRFAAAAVQLVGSSSVRVLLALCVCLSPMSDVPGNTVLPSKPLLQASRQVHDDAPEWLTSTDWSINFLLGNASL